MIAPAHARATAALVSASLLGLAATSIGGCDQGPQEDASFRGPPVRVVSTNFEGGRTVPANGSLQIAFDRVLHPVSVNRQAAIVLSAAGRVVGNPVVRFDPITRVLSLSAPNPRGAAWLTPGQPYVLYLTHPDDPESPGGVRAFDGATLDRDATRRLGFFAGPEETDEAVRGFEPEVDFCRDVLPLFRLRCADGGCHGTPADDARPAVSLVLDTPSGVANTAIGRVARGANTGPRAGFGTPAARVFGVDMAIVEPDSPASSWLLYKLLIAEPRDDRAPAPPARAARCDPSAPEAEPVTIGPPLTNAAPIDSEERARLADAILGQPMPYPPQPGADDRSENLSFEELQRVRAWIAQGAKVIECGSCLP